MMKGERRVLLEAESCCLSLVKPSCCWGSPRPCLILPMLRAQRNCQHFCPWSAWPCPFGARHVLKNVFLQQLISPFHSGGVEER